MKRPARIALAALGGVALLAVLAGVAVLVIAHSDWLREKLRTTIIEQAETATGGRIEIRKFDLKWSTLTAEVEGFVIYGTEGANEAPLLAADRVAVGFRIISLFRKDVRLARIIVTHPQVHLIVDAAGGTNLPRPKVSRNGKNAIDTILDLKIADVEVHNGGALVELPGAPPRIYPWSGTARDLTMLATYDPVRDRYSGTVSLAPAHLALQNYGPIDLDVNIAAAMERNRVVVSKATLKSANSEIDLTNLTIGSFAAPVVTAAYSVKASVPEAVRVLRLNVPLSGTVNLSGNARYISANDFDVTGNLRGSDLAWRNFRNIHLTGKLAGTQAKMTLSALRLNLLGGEVTGSVETTGYESYRVSGSIRDLDARSIAALGTPKPVPYDGQVSGTVAATGRFSNLTRPFEATAHLTVAPAKLGPAVHGEISARYTGAQRKIEMGQSWLELPHTHLDVSGALGSSLTVNLQTHDFDDLLPVLNGRPLPVSLRDGSAAFVGSVNGSLDDPHIAGHADLRNVVYDGKIIDSAAADVTASMNAASASNATVVYDGITATGSGSIGLTGWTTTDASAVSGNVSVGSLDIGHALTLANRKNVPVTGMLTLAAHVTGTLGHPVGEADITLSKGLIYQQPYDSVIARVQYTGPASQTLSGVFVSGPKRVTFQATDTGSGQPFPAGMLQLSVTSNNMPLNQIALVRRRQPDILGTAQFHVTASIRATRDAKNALRFEPVNVDGDGSVAGIKLGGRDLGDMHFTARTQGAILTASFDSNAANAVIKGQARVELTAGNRTTGSITFSNAQLSSLAAVLMTPADAKNLTVDGAAEGQVDFNGPLSAPLQMSATATIRQIEVHPLPGTSLATSMPGFSIHNNGPVKVSFEKSVIRVDTARFQAPQTDMSLSGTADTKSSAPMDFHLQGDVNIAILRSFVPESASSGTVSINSSIRGAWSAPDLSGHASIHNAEFHFPDFPNGLTNANGEIVFSGSRATIQSFSGETGGGKLTASGFAALNAGSVTFQLTAKTKDVRLRYPQGISSVSDADLQLVRNAQRSSISGLVTVRRLVFKPQQDAAGMLAGIGQASAAPEAGQNSLSEMNLDIRIQTAPDVALQSSIAEGIQADAALTLRGTLSNPALLGRINVSQGDVVFFGNKYTITRGSISFFNPNKIEPILDVDLQTKARGVDVTLTVTGPPSKLAMTYRSDPPLEFSDIVALLATGRTPDDPSAALRSNAPSPSFEQIGASALIGQTIANPVAGRLQRFFGVSRIKIDPQLSGITGNPGARLTVEQQVTPDLLFTYVTDVSNTSEQLIRVEWAFNRNWSAILEREEDGYVGVDFTYKKRFR